MKTRIFLISTGIALAAVVPANAQSTAGNTCSGKEAVGSLGISGIACNCTIGRPGSGDVWQFRSEPVITSLETDSRAGAVLKIGDVITHVNGKSIRTAEGAALLANVRPGQAIILTIRRNGQPLKYALTAESACPTDPGLLGMYAPARIGSGHAAAATPVVAPPLRGSLSTAPVRPSGAAPKATYSAMPKASFGMGLACTGNCSIKVSEKNGTPMMSFSEPPEVYSIEKGGPADQAGIQRGDILLRIDGAPMDGAAGGKLFATAQPGQTVSFTVKRGKETKNILVRAAPHTTPMPALARSTESIDRARQSVEQLQREQEVQMRRLQESVQSAHRLEDDQVRRLHRELLNMERAHNEKLSKLAHELSQADTRMRVATGSAGASCAVPMPAPSASLTVNRTLRYSGSLGESDIEVRGGAPVSVTESRDEIVITTGGTVVRVKKSRK